MEHLTLWYENGQIKAELTFKDGECISGCDYLNRPLPRFD
jgi:hypothetical protein